MSYVDLLQKTRQDEAAVGFLREQVAIPHTDPAYFSLLAASYGALNRFTLQHQAVGEMYLLMGSVPAAVEQYQLARRAADADFYVLSEVDARLRQINARLQEQQREDRAQGKRPSEGRNPG
jgi:predicted Zn-dependent protease